MRLTQWKKTGLTEGTKVTGGQSAPPTRWWNHLYLALLGWQTIVTFRVSEETAKHGYMVGYTTEDSHSWCKCVVRHEDTFSMRIGHEDCQFFVLEVVHPELLGTGIVQNAKLVLPEVIARGPLH